jgi:hypothetical protein
MILHDRGTTLLRNVFFFFFLDDWRSIISIADASVLLVCLGRISSSGRCRSNNRVTQLENLLKYSSFRFRVDGLVVVVVVRVPVPE